jgi:hypothetical protein
MIRKIKKQLRSNKKGSRDNQTPVAMAVQLMRIPPIIRNPIHAFRRALTRSFTWNPSTSGIDGVAGASTMQITFSPSATDFRLAGVSIYLDSLPNVSEFSNLYDQWRIKDVCTVFDFSSFSYSNSGGVNNAPIVHHIVDYDDQNDVQLTSMLQFPQSRRHIFNENGYKPLILKFKPRPLMDVAGSGLTTGYAPMKDTPFLRTLDMTLPHYSLKFAFQNFGGTAAVLIPFQITVYYDLEFCNPK